MTTFTDQTDRKSHKNYIHCQSQSVLFLIHDLSQDLVNKGNMTGATSGTGGTDYLPGEPEFTHGFSGVLVARSFAYCVVLCRSLFVLWYFFFWPLYCLSFGHCIVCFLAIVLSVFWPLYCLSFGHCIVCLLAIVLSVFWPFYFLSFGHCIGCPSSFYGFWLPLCYLGLLSEWLSFNSAIFQLYLEENKLIFNEMKKSALY